MIQLDALSRRYGVRPSEFIKGDLSEFIFDLVIMHHGLVEESKKNNGKKTGSHAIVNN